MVISCWFSCANIQGITGGPDDLAPPQWVISGSSPNLQTNFKGREINFLFDEWFRLDNPVGNIQIAPSTVYPLEVKVSGKKLTVKFDEKENLDSNSTYILQLGTAIRDITKGNIAQNIQYVFSTGNFIDSLSISGNVTDAFSGEIQKQILVCLYLESEDSVFRTRKPYYFSRTNDGGQFELKHLKSGVYTIYALADKNSNNYFDQPTESIGFLDTPIQLQTDAPVTNVLLKLSLQKNTLNHKEKILKPGMTTIVLSRKSEDRIALDTDNDSVIVHSSADSILAWNYTQKDQQFSIQVENYKDTFIVHPFIRPQQDTGFHFKLTNVTIAPDEPLKLKSEFPVREVTEADFIRTDSLHSNFKINKDSTDPRVILIYGNWPVGQQTSITLKAGAIQNCFGQFNLPDTLRVISPPLNSYSSLHLQIDSLITGGRMLFQLLRNNILISETPLQLLPPGGEHTFKYLPPGNYRLRVIHDVNENNQWDGSDLKNKKQAEDVWYFNLPELRADWEVKAKIKI